MNSHPYISVTSSSAALAISASTDPGKNPGKENGLPRPHPQRGNSATLELQ
jgi:hypothetical protein